MRTSRSQLKLSINKANWYRTLKPNRTKTAKSSSSMSLTSWLSRKACSLPARDRNFRSKSSISTRKTVSKSLTTIPEKLKLFFNENRSRYLANNSTLTEFARNFRKYARCARSSNAKIRNAKMCAAGTAEMPIKKWIVQNNRSQNALHHL